MDKLWAGARPELEALVGTNNYVTWLAPLSLRAIEGGAADISCPTRFLSDWVSRHYSRPIIDALSRQGAAVERVSFTVATGRPATAIPAAASPAPSAQAARARAPQRDDEMSAPLDARYTFDNFVVGKPNELAHAAARRVAEGGPVTFNPLFLYGGVGLGKTHLMHAIACERRARDPEARVLYLSAEQFMYRFVQALRERTVMDFKEMFRTVDLLMVDDAVSYTHLTLPTICSV